jgi:hypothetical protein
LNKLAKKYIIANRNSIYYISFYTKERVYMNLENLLSKTGKQIGENLINTFLKEIKNYMNENYVIDRFEGNIAVCENQQTGEMVDIPKENLPQNIVSGMSIKKVNGKFEIDILNCAITRKNVVNALKENWENTENLYVVNNVLNKALKCTNIEKNENIYIKDEAIISKSDKGTIIQKNGENFTIDFEKTAELKETLKKLAN